MLTQNFKTAMDLGLKTEQYDALCKTLVLMETGEIVHVPMPPYVLLWEQAKPTFTGKFNMHTWQDNTDCGTVACIGGTADLVGHLKGRSSFSFLFGCVRDRNSELFNLFCPGMTKYRYEDITVEQAARALRNYLTVGSPCWNEVLEVQPLRVEGTALVEI